MAWLTRIKDSLLSKIGKKIPKKDLESIEKTRQEKKGDKPQSRPPRTLPLASDGTGQRQHRDWAGPARCRNGPPGTVSGAHLEVSFCPVESGSVRGNEMPTICCVSARCCRFSGNDLGN